MNCPKCEQGEMWDNRDNKTNPKAPDYKCKDKDCNHAIWPEKGKILEEMADDQEQIDKERGVKTEGKPDWDKIAKGKVRHGIMVAHITKGDKLTPELKEIMEEEVDYVMFGDDKKV